MIEMELQQAIDAVKRRQRQPNECERCDVVAGEPVVTGEVYARERVGDTMVLAYLCPMGHQWREQLPVGDPRIPPLAPLREPRPAAPPPRCSVDGCHYSVVPSSANGAGKCFFHRDGKE